MSYVTHLTANDFDRLLEERLSRDATRAAHHHLWLCRECRSAFLDHEEAPLYLEEVYGAGTAATWRETLDEPVDTLGRVAARSFRMRGLSPPHLRMKTVSSKAFHDVGAVAVVLEKAYGLRKDAPADAKTLLEGAIQALESHHDWPADVRSYLRARTFAYHGNACRILYEFDKARASFTKVYKYLEKADEPGLRGFVLAGEGNLEKDRGDYEAAVAKLQEALNVLPDCEAVTRLEAAITLANAYGLAGKWEQNVETLRRLVEEHPEAAFPPGAYLACLQSLAWGYAHLGRADEAWDLYPEVKRLAVAEGNRLDLVRVRWLAAEIYKSQGKRTQAARRFREVTAKFLAAEIPMDAALATLSQAEMYLDLGDTKAAARLAEVLVPIFRSKSFHREAGVAGLMVVEDLRCEAATAGQVRKLVNRLHAGSRRRYNSSQ